MTDSIQLQLEAANLEGYEEGLRHGYADGRERGFEEGYIEGRKQQEIVREPLKHLLED